MLDPARQRRQFIRLLIVASVVFVLCGGVYGLYRLNSKQQGTLTDEQRIAQARDAYDQQAYDEVVRLLENPASNDSTIQAIQQEPDLLRIYVTARQAIPLYNQRHLSRVVTPLTQLVELDPQDVMSRHMLLDALLTLDRNDEALKLATQLAEQHPDDAPLLRQLGQAQLRKGQIEAALGSLNQSIRVEPLHVQTHAQMLDLVQQYDQPIEAFIEQADRIYQARADDPRGMMIQALAHEAQGNGVQARDLLKRASQLPPGDESVIPLLTQWLDRSGMVATATRYLLRHADQGIETPAGRMAIYRAFEIKDYGTILARLQDSQPDQANSDLLGMWVSAHLNAGDPAQADTLLKELARRDNAIASTWVELLEMDRQQDSSPARTIDSIIEVLKDRNDQAIQSMTRRHPYFMQRLGEAYLEALEPEAAYGAFSVAASNSSSWARPHLALAQTLIKLRQPTGALIHAREAQVRDNNAASKRWLALAMASAADPGDQAAVDRVLREADKIAPESEQARQVLPAVVNLLARAGRKDEAKQRVATALGDATASAQLLEGLLRVSQRHELGLDAAITQAIESRFGTTPGLALIQAEQLAAEQGAAAGRRLIEQAGPDPVTKAWQTTLAEYIAKYEPGSAAEFLIGLAEQHPDDLALQLAALKAVSPEDHRAFFSDAIQRLKKLAGEGSIHWRLQQARVAMLDPGNKQALTQTAELLDRAQGLTPIHLELRLVLARCYLLLDDPLNAADRAQAAKAIAPRNARAMLLNGMALHRLERFEEARLDLIPLAADSRLDPGTRLQACVMLIEQGEPEPVRQAAEQMWAAGQANNQLLIILARIYSGAGEFAKADRVCQALTKIPELETLRFVSAYYHQTNRPEFAEQAIRDAQSTGMSETDRLMLLAEDAAHRGETDTALRLIEQAAASGEQNEQRWVEAVQLALSMARPEDATRLAKLGLEAFGDAPGLAAIVTHDKLIRQVQDDASLIPMAVSVLRDEAQRPQAIRALRITAETGAPDQAALALASLAKQHPDFKYLSELAGDRLLQAGENEQAYELSKVAMARFPDSAAAARIATLTSFRLQDWAMLLSSANAWAERNPRDRANADLMRAAAMNKLDRFGTTVKTLGPYIRTLNRVDESNQLFFEYYTHALVQNGEAAEAWSELTAYLSTSRTARSIALKRVSEDLAQADTAAAWLKEIATVGSDDAQERFAIASASFLAGQRLADDGLVRLADQTITRLLSTPGPHPVEWRYAQGQIAQRLGDLGRAEASYRGVMASMPDNPLVLNNLALVLSERGEGPLAEAEQLAKRAVQLSSEDPNLLDTLAIIQLRRSRFDEALKTIESAIELDNNNPAWRLTQADIYEAMGEPERAALIRERYKPRLRD